MSSNLLSAYSALPVSSSTSVSTCSSLISSLCRSTNSAFTEASISRSMVFSSARESSFF